MEQSLKRLEEQEQKYSAELDAALTSMPGFGSRLRTRPWCSHEVAEAIRPQQEQEAEKRAQEVYGESTAQS